MKFLFIFTIILFFSCNKISNPCDIMCDNCIGIEQCNECYDDCYNSIENE